MKSINVQTSRVNTSSGEVVEQSTAQMRLVPPSDPEACQSCARRHSVDQPHDATSLHYQYSFYADHGRWPTWKDAVAHCEPPVREAWERELRVRGRWPTDE